MSEQLTLQQQRRAIHDGMVKSRGTGSQAQAQRRAGGDAMVERRTGKKLVDDVNAITKSESAPKLLPSVPSRGGLPTSVGVGTFKGGGAQQSGGAAGPFTEEDYTKREWWASGLPSSDGLLVFPAEKKVLMTDGNGAEVVFNYAEPVQ
ncbi:hypothetical protein NAV33_07215 [Pseudomonas stutzeri]|uniref:hypothetical protein n=1 Tax=Stutzerimonas stutzeri TaxID=316 RepID=UPI00210CE9C0|nr:hypothetical protein [Stutzerimonas stutzeri]MCQ4311683.1 hypothetical protein [Stutzerimonas stutzeri]